MKISIAMTSYNGANYIEEQMESIRNQTRPADEVVIRDDRSKDATPDIIRSYIKKYRLERTWHLYLGEKNAGYAANFIKAADLTSGDLVFFSDQDDIWMPDKIERMARLMEEHGEILMLGSEFTTFYTGSARLHLPDTATEHFKGDGSLEQMTVQPRNIFLGCEGCTICVRKSFYDEVRPYWFEGWAHDEFVWKLSLCLDGCYLYHAATVRRRIHDGNVSLAKMRSLSQRIQFLKNLQKSHETSLRFAKCSGIDKNAEPLLKKNIEATKLRIKILKEKRILYTLVTAIRYPECYHNKKSILAELYMAVKG